jgi:hypothetical protein
MSELRKEVETKLGVVKPAKIGRRTPSFTINEAPTHWRKTLKAWGLFFLCVFVVSLLFGFVVGLIHRGYTP